MGLELSKKWGRGGQKGKEYWEHSWQCKVSLIHSQDPHSSLSPQPSSSSTLQLGQEAFPLPYGLKVTTGHWLSL